MEMEQVLELREGEFARWAEDELHRVRPQMTEVFLSEEEGKLAKARKLIELLPPGANICGFHVLRQDGKCVEDAYGDLRSLRGFCLRRGRKVFHYPDGTKKPMGFLGLIGPVEDRLSGHIYFGDAGWVSLPHIPVFAAGVGRRFDIFEERRSHLSFRESHNPGVLDMVLGMFERVITDQLDTPFDPPQLRLVLPRSRKVKLWREDPLFKAHLADTVRTGAWGIQGAGLRAPIDGRVTFKGKEIVIEGSSRVEIAQEDAATTLEKMIKDIFGETLTPEIESQIPAGGTYSVSRGMPLWRPRSVVPLNETSEDTLERIRNLGIDKFASDQRYKFITAWAALTTLEKAGPVETLDGTFTSSSAVPRVCGMSYPVVFTTFGREKALRNEPVRPNSRVKLSAAELSRLRQKRKEDTLLLVDYGSPAAARLKQTQQLRRRKVKFSRVGKQPATKSVGSSS